VVFKKSFKQKARLCLLTSIIFLLASTNTTQAKNSKNEVKIYTVGIIPQFEVRKLFGIWRPVLDHLQTATGLKFKFKSAKSIPEFQKKLIGGEFDFAYMNPYQSVLTQKTQGYIPLVRDHSKNLQGILVVRNDSSINDIKQLEGNTLAFPAPNALGASLMLRAELMNLHHIKFNSSYVKTHDSVYLNVIYKKVAAGGGVEKTFNWQNPEIKNSLRIIYRTQSVAPHPLAVHPRIDMKAATKVQRALLNMDNTEKGKKLLAKIPIKKIGIAVIDDYLPLLNMGLDKVIDADKI